MSTNPSSLPAQNHGKSTSFRRGLVSVRTVEAPRREKTEPDIRRQAVAIIEALLAVSDPETAHEREQLKQFVDAHPGQPEVALAHHLLAVRPLLEKLNDGEHPESGNEALV
ncbi:hypothetical protein [Arthrobacter sp. B3I4]|uniref:hypothetical protein n=1 Tax=Arthrobacter sp. B3I4 TaxID=3042267 RepID=UPI002785092F|nr:hypothetical protein [Arthrobacter sp. B3I4]MDQ0754505.1 hypothetical protein [Arthrobacter sp. B3I4]